MPAATPSTVDLRPTQSADRDALIAMFSGLPEADRRLRFFGPHDVARHVDRWLALPDTISIVAVDADDRVVGEGGVARIEDGMGEFALSVLPDARGGTGTRLFDELRRQASAAGITILYGDVLTTNAPMLALLRRSGGVTIERPEPQTVGVVVGTATTAPGWPDRSRPRVLVEASDGRWSGEDQLRTHGVDVAVCPGPSARRASMPCPALAEARCPLVAEADVIVHALSPTDPAHQALARCLSDQVTPAQRLLIGAAGAPEVLAHLEGMPRPLRRTANVPLARAE